jgi:hypothetical protein
MTSIANYMNDLDESFPSIDTIAADAYLSPRQVLDCIPKLEVLGEVSVSRGQGMRGLGGRTNLYRFPLMPPSQRAIKRAAKTAPLSNLTQQEAAPHSLAERGADSAPLFSPKDVRFSTERGEKSSRDSSPEPLRTDRTEKQHPPIPPSADTSSSSGEKPGQRGPLPPLPDWIPENAWRHYIEMRKYIRKPMTPRAVLLAVQTLDQLMSEGNSPEAVLNQSILNSWSGLFEVHNGQRTRSEQRQRRNLDAIEEGLRRARR